MNTISKTAALLALGSLLVSPVLALESKPVKAEGLSRVQLVTAVDEIVPGEAFYAGVIFDHEPGFHTYWRGPGIVGVATMLEWTLPEGFSAGEILWPPPQETDMAGIAANGYETETCLLTRIEVPETIEGDTVTLKVKCAWMACADSCHPGVKDFSLTIPVTRTGTQVKQDSQTRKMFDQVLASIPPDAPGDWEFQVSLNGDKIALRVEIEDGNHTDLFDTEFHFFCDDLQVDSDKPQGVRLTGNAAHSDLTITMTRPEIAPGTPEVLSGLLYSSKGWPGIDSRWVEVSVPWPEGTFPDE